MATERAGAGIGEFALGGYFPGALGQITALHGTYYHRYWGFDITFERQVASELSDFLGRLDPARDLLLTARDQELAGSVAVDGGTLGEPGARLRWFLVRPDLQGAGLGGRLLERAVEFARRAGHESMFLWTFAGLEAARALYLRQGFSLAEEHHQRIWGQTITEQKYLLEL